MLEPFTTLHEAGFSAPGADAAVGWSVEVITALDWMRLAELARALAAEAGCELAGSRAMADGSVLFGMIEQPRSPKPQRALVKLAPWNDWGANTGTVERFAQEVATARDTRGILIAPAGFSTSAHHAAQQHRIEAVDASALFQAVQALPADRRDFLFVVTTAGDATTPSCPLCQQKLRRAEQPVESLPSRTIDSSGIIAEPVVCDQLCVNAGCEATFLQEVRSRSIQVAGHVNGDFICHGPVILEPGATLSGSVAARSLIVRDGGALLGQFRILEGDLEPLVPQTVRWQWRCAASTGRAGCPKIAFEPHDSP